MCCRANIVGCIICPNASITAGSELRDCLVGSGQTVSGKNTSVQCIPYCSHILCFVSLMQHQVHEYRQHSSVMSYRNAEIKYVLCVN